MGGRNIRGNTTATLIREDRKERSVFFKIHFLSSLPATRHNYVLMTLCGFTEAVFCFNMSILLFPLRH